MVNATQDGEGISGIQQSPVWAYRWGYIDICMYLPYHASERRSAGLNPANRSDGNHSLYLPLTFIAEFEKVSMC